MASSFLFRISPEDEWRAAQAEGGLLGGELDRKSGFVHLSDAEQVPSTLALFFAGRDDLYLLKIDPSELGDGVKWEVVSNSDTKFPHFYGRSGDHAPIPLAAIVDVTKLILANGKHVLPPLV